MAMEVIGTRRRIIRRPRLTKLLDENPARIKLLIAPAGYGKTTLAEQWLANDRHGLWHRGAPASADVAALALEIATILGEQTGGGGERLRERLRATTDPASDAEVLAELLAEGFVAWPSNRWLVLDDYHFAMESEASERFVEALAIETPIQLLITSRRRPSWATARRILYGELQEVDRRDLIVSDAEAEQILGSVDAEPTSLVARAQGWPAVIGLAALTSDVPAPDIEVPPALYDFFAEELYQSARPLTQRWLRILATAPLLDHGTALSLLDNDSVAATALDECASIGALTEHPSGRIEFHPLLREFYLRKLREIGDPPIPWLVSRLTQHYLDAQEWDALFSVAETFSSRAALTSLIAGALRRTLHDGRIRTVERWVALAEQIHSTSPVIDLAEAELAFRRGEPTKAEVLANGSGLALDRDHPLRSSAFARAGQSALLADHQQAALRYFQQAEDSARTREDETEAIVGAFFATLELDEDDTATFARLEKALAGAPDKVVRLAGARLYRASRFGGLREALEMARQAFPMLDKEPDPVARTSFLNSYLQVAALTSAYEEAIEVADRLLAEAMTYRLTFPVPHAHLGAAVAYAGIRSFAQARRCLENARAVSAPGDVYVAMNRQAIESRLLCQLGRAEEAVTLTSHVWPRETAGNLFAEFLASRALALASIGDLEKAAATCAQAERASKNGVEWSVLSACVRLIVASGRGEGLPTAVDDLWTVVHRTGNTDSLVCAYRAAPVLLRALLAHSDEDEYVAWLLSRGRDVSLAKAEGLPVIAEDPGSTLSPRELEVLQLLAAGLSNKEIATQLFIEPTTVKAHVRHILEKTGARSRGDAVAKASAYVTQAATEE